MIVAQLQNYVNCFFVFENMVKTHNTMMFQRFVYFYFSNELNLKNLYFLFCFRFFENLFAHHFDCINFPSFSIGKLITFGKATLAENFPSHISAYFLSIAFVCEYFFNNRTFLCVLGCFEGVLFFLYRIVHFHYNNFWVQSILIKTKKLKNNKKQ